MSYTLGARYLSKNTVNLYTTLFVINHQQHVSAIKAIFGLNTIIIGNIYYNAMNVTDMLLH
jgi:hypothetical protein